MSLEMEPISIDLYKQLVKIYESSRWILDSSNWFYWYNTFLFRKAIWRIKSPQNYLKQIPKQMKNTNTKTIEKEKIVAEKLNGRFAMMGFIALVGAYLTTGQIIPGFI